MEVAKKREVAEAAQLVRRLIGLAVDGELDASEADLAALERAAIVLDAVAGAGSGSHLR